MTLNHTDTISIECCSVASVFGFNCSVNKSQNMDNVLADTDRIAVKKADSLGLYANGRTFLRSSENGATIVEFSVAALILFTFLITAAEMLRLTYASLTLQFASARVMRQTVIGPPEISPDSYNHVVRMENELIAISSGLGVRLNREAITICPRTDLECEENSAGAPRELVALQVRRPSNTVFLGDYLVTALAVGRNEPYPLP